MPSKQEPQTPKQSVPISLKWKYIDAPKDFPEPHEDDVPEPHEDFKIHNSSKIIINNGAFQIFGASVRGLLHKHEGTNCDDWFEIEAAGHWTIIAVADGAGSKKFSRIGAKESCKKAVEELKKSLKFLQLTDFETKLAWQDACNPKINLESIDENIKTFRDAVTEASEAVIKAFFSSCERLKNYANDSANQEKFNALLGRDFIVDDLACTLNIAIHYPSKWGSMIIGCQIGDGLIGIVMPDGQSKVLSKSDSGGYAGETKFLVSEGMCKDDVLLPRTEFFPDSISALLVMTDGVSNDFFPDTGSPTRLWAELLMNGIPDVNVGLSNADPNSNIDLKIYSETREVVEKEPRTSVLIRSASAYSEARGIKVEELFPCPEKALFAHVVAKIEGRPNPQNDSDGARLRLWLDAFYKKGGSKDDRSLVVLHPVVLHPEVKP